jgi:putative membrane protein
MKGSTGWLALAAFIMAATPALAKDNISKQDRAFATTAMAGNMMEVQVGTMAQQQGASDAVHSFGKRLVDDHTKANDELTTIAGQLGIKPPASLPGSEQKKVDTLSKLNGAEFDTAFAPMIVKDHEHDIKAFEKEAKSGKNAELKSYATEILPTLKEHLAMARDISSSPRASINTQEEQAAEPEKK